MKSQTLSLIAIILAGVSLDLAGCAHLPHEGGGHFHETGTASWYGAKFQGRLTASGERFDMHHLTAAHRTLPLGSRVRVKSVTTGRSVIVTINDRGPQSKSRVLDLSYAAAEQLGIVNLGTDKIEIESE